ncbi:RDD family protein [Mycoplasma testudineum]|uniref:RDD family protein n=1 Tax=Mycoplasma testudineum TaxID=244584 RepID=A0A4R6IF55_9MOLU|nr:RDD family protein [Mycoplasma testudineum]OYD26871.1 hypothetical protein CG473_02040 [Mycoplasma testudineum]TDO20406.1 RDD family protein [Mycoplasma testudineum]
MWKYKEAKFWIKLLVSLIDTIINIALIIAYSFIISSNNSTISAGHYYSFMFLAIITPLIYFYLFPLIFNNRTISLFLFKLKYINKNNGNIYYTDYLKRALILSGLVVLAFLLFVILVPVTTINKLVNNVTLDFWTSMAYSVPGAVATAWVLVSTINLLVTLLSKNQYSLQDKLFGTHLVYTKKIYIKIDTRKLVAIPVKKLSIVWKD